MGHENHQPKQTSSEGSAGDAADPSISAVGVWLLLGTLTAGLALAFFDVTVLGGTHVLLQGQETTAGHRGFASVNAAAAVISYAAAYRVYQNPLQDD